MIYLDTSVALAQIFGEPRLPDPRIWSESLVSSRLLEYEVWTRVHARDAAAGEAARALLSRVSMVAMDGGVLARATDPWPTPVRTLDALHLATALWLRGRGQKVELLTWDARMRQAGLGVGLVLCEA